MSARTLLAVSAALTPKQRDGIARGEEPRRDLELLREMTGADVIDPGPVGFGGWPLAGLRLAAKVARAGRAYDNVFADGEHIALPLAAVLRPRRTRPRVTAVGHYLTPRKKKIFARVTGASGMISRIAIHSETQRPHAREMGFADRQIWLVPYQVDTEFWQPQERPAEDQMCAAGLEFRDYRTMLAAMRGLPISADIAVASPWSKRRPNFQLAEVPENVRIVRHAYAGLRDMYARSRFVAVPLRDVDFQAGIITILEAMAMARAVIVTRTRGQIGTVSGPLFTDAGLSEEIVEQPDYHPNGVYVTPESPQALRSAIEYLMRHPEDAARMGANGRRFVSEQCTVEQYASRLAAMIEDGDG